MITSLRTRLVVVFTSLLVVLFSPLVVASINAAALLDVTIEQTEVTNGGQALRAIVYEPASEMRTYWVGGTFEFKLENPSTGSSCVTKHAVSNGIGEVYGSCVSGDGQPLSVYLEQSGTGLKSAVVQITPSPISAPISPPSFVQPPISAPVLPISAPINAPVLQIVTDTLPTGTVSVAYQATFKALSSDVTKPIEVAITALPNGITVACAEGVEFLRARRAANCYFTGVPTQHGTIQVQAIVKAGESTVAKEYTVTFRNRRPYIEVASLGKGVVGKAYKATVKAYDFDLTDSLELSIEQLPLGLTPECSQKFNLFRTRLVKTCEISGTPTVAGLYNVSLTARDSGGNQTSQVVVVPIAVNQGAVQGVATASAQAPRIADASPAIGRTGLPYRGVIHGTVFTTLAAPTIEVAGLPEGIIATCSSSRAFLRQRYDVSCELTGLRQNAVSTLIDVKLTDALGQIHQAALPLEIVNKPVEISTTQLKSGKMLKRYKAEIVAVDPDVTDTLNLQLSNVPIGLSISCNQQNTFFGRSKKATCRLDGVPLVAGTFEIVVSADDGAGHVAEKVVPLQILGE